MPITTISVIESSTPSGEGPVDRAAVEGWAGEALSRVDGFKVRAAAAGDRRWQATVRVGRRAAAGARSEDGGALPRDRRWREVEVVIELRAVDPAATAAPAPARPRTWAAPRYSGRGRVGENVGVFDDDRGLVERAVVAAARDLALVGELETAPEAAVVARLQDAGAAGVARLRAIEAAGARRLIGAVPALVALVPDPELGPRATGALVAIGDPRAVGALIESARDRPLVSIVYAVAQIGGKEAEAWLFTLTSGHPAPAIRDAAREALAELERRRER